MLTTNHSEYQAKFDLLQEMAIEHIEEILFELEITFKRASNGYYTFCCPIHQGDNPRAGQIYGPDGKYPGRFRCASSGCEKKYGSGLINFIHGVLDSNNNASRHDAVKWLCKFLGTDFNKLEVNTEEIEKKQFIRRQDTSSKSAPIATGPSRDSIRSRLLIPSPQFLNRGFSRDILDRYDVGVCQDSTKKYYTRTIIPIYDENYKYVIGCTARTPYPLCKYCNYYHRTNYRCPETDYEAFIGAKWIKNFDTSNVLFNYWFAKNEIRKSKIAILVEGPGDCLKLAESGIQSLALFGNSLKGGQADLLDKLGVTSLICMLDNDEGGIKGALNIKEQYSRVYRMYFPKFDGKDCGDLNSDVITTDIKPIIDKLVSYE